jgi:hypothetical protein
VPLAPGKNGKSNVAADVSWDHKTIRLALWLREKGQEEVLEQALRHEILHCLLEKPSDQEAPHREWCFRHDTLAKITHRLDRILRTGTDGS